MPLAVQKAACTGIGRMARRQARKQGCAARPRRTRARHAAPGPDQCMGAIPRRLDLRAAFVVSLRHCVDLRSGGVGALATAAAAAAGLIVVATAATAAAAAAASARCLCSAATQARAHVSRSHARGWRMFYPRSAKRSLHGHHSHGRGRQARIRGAAHESTSRSTWPQPAAPGNRPPP